MRRWFRLGLVFVGAAPLWAQAAGGAGAPGESAVSELQTLAATVVDARVALDTVWVLFAAFLVFFMNTGFAMVESGLCRAKNTVNILAKNFIVFAISSIAFWLLGWD